MTIGTASISGLWIVRNVYLEFWRKYKGLPDGPYEFNPWKCIRFSLIW